MEEKKPKKKKTWLWIVVGLIVLFGLIGACNEGSNDDTKRSEDAAIETAAAETPDDQQEAEQPEESAEPEETKEPEKDVKTYKAGMYKVGSDLPAGEYCVMAKGHSAYVEVANDSSGTLDSIVTNDNVSTFAFVTVSDGQYLEVTGGTFVAAEDADIPGPNADGVYGEGTYRVGKDIEAGEYKVTCTNGVFAYVEVSVDSRGVLDSIVTNDNIESSAYITVSDGQYLKVSGGEFSK